MMSKCQFGLSFNAPCERRHRCCMSLSPEPHVKIPKHILRLLTVWSSRKPADSTSCRQPHSLTSRSRGRCWNRCHQAKTCR